MNTLPSKQLTFLPENDADLVLRPHYPAFRKIIYGAWQDYEKLPVDKKAQLTPTARANCIYCFIVYRAKSYFSKAVGIKNIERRGLIMFLIDGKVFIRFKKLRDNKRASNIPTKQQVALSMQLDLPGIEPAVRLIVGYQLNSTQTGIKAILITYPDGQEVKWDIPISTTDDEGQVVEMPVKQQPTRKPKVKAKNIRKKQTKES